MMKTKKIKSLSLLALSALLPLNTNALEKNEMVYTNLDYDGSVKTSTVTNHLSFVGSNDFVDESELKDILNLNGEEKFVIASDKITWSPLGEDIFYKGTIEKNVPIKTSIKYYLDGEECDIGDMLGKQGQVKIVYSFSNENKNYTSINGRMEAIYTPFMTMSATLLDDTAKNVSVSNGKVTATGKKTLVLGVASPGLYSPGLYSSTKIPSLKDLDRVTITYDTENFSLGSTYIISTPKVFDDFDLSIFDKTSTLTKDLNSLKSNMDLLEKGCKELESGAVKISTGSSSLSSNLEKTLAAVSSLKKGSSSLNDGMHELSTGLANLSTAIDKEKLTLLGKNMAAVKSKNEIQINRLLSLVNKTLEELTISYVTNGLDAYSGTDATLLLEKNVYETIVLLKENEGIMDANLAVLNGLDATISKMATAVESIEKLIAGTKQLDAGLSSLSTGLDLLYKGSVDLTNGTAELKKGAKTLSVGTTKFNEEGIDKVVESIQSVKMYSDRARTLVTLSKNYRGFASNNSTSTTFISMIKPCK